MYRGNSFARFMTTLLLCFQDKRCLLQEPFCSAVQRWALTQGLHSAIGGPVGRKKIIKKQKQNGRETDEFLKRSAVWMRTDGSFDENKPPFCRVSQCKLCLLRLFAMGAMERPSCNIQLMQCFGSEITVRSVSVSFAIVASNRLWVVAGSFWLNAHMKLPPWWMDAGNTMTHGVVNLDSFVHFYRKLTSNIEQKIKMCECSFTSNQRFVNMPLNHSGFSGFPFVLVTNYIAACHSRHQNCKLTQMECVQNRKNSVK